MKIIRLICVIVGDIIYKFGIWLTQTGILIRNLFNGYH